jgi:2-polyprenyl-6-methoxyphenol hydroxylase-like FAD-dependent oxidoreductase
MNSTDVAIVGGGVAGGACACAFAASPGVRVLALERRELARDPNRGDALDAVTVSHLERWGVMPEVRRRGAVELREMIVTARGRTLGRLRLPRPMLMLDHAEIEAALLATAVAHGARFERTTVRELRFAEIGGTLATDAGEVTARLVVAADGGSSSMRARLGIEADRHEYSEAAVIVHAGRPHWLAPDCAWAMIHPAGGVLILPTSPAGRCRIGIFTHPEETREWLLADAAEMRERLGARCERLLDLDIDRGHGAHLYRLARQHARRYFSGPVALVGDAAHVTHPNGGQGMNLAVRDAAALSAAIAPLLTGREGSDARPEEALREYELRRRPAAHKAMRRAHRLARLERADRATYAVAKLAAGLFVRTPGLSAWALSRAAPG